MISLEHIDMVFNPGTVNENRVLRDLSLTVKPGDFITIIGSNGAGKTTLFNVIAGSVMPTSGKIRFDDRDVTRMPEYRRAARIGRIFQNPLLGTASNMTLEDNMMICFRKGGKGLRVSLNGRMRELFREKLRVLDMGLETRLKDNVGLLSGGQRQALTLLMAVLSKPDLLLLDEHIAALDPKNAELILSLTMRFIGEYRLTAMMITHNMSHAIRYGNRLLMMDGGEIILDVEGDEKRALTVETLMDRFRSIRHRTLETDRILLSDTETGGA